MFKFTIYGIMFLKKGGWVMSKDRILTVSIFCLALSIIIAGNKISKAIENNGVIVSNGVSMGLSNINNSNIEMFNNSVNSDILDIYTASQYLGISDDQVREIMRDEKSKIPYIDIKGDVRFSKKALDKWIEESNFKM